MGMKIDGGCHCGEIRFEAEVNPHRTIICHCTDCQTISGAPYRVNVVAPTAKFRMTGAPKTYVKVGSSGDRVVTAFCGDCGSALYSCKGDDPEFLFVRVGSVNQRAELVPEAQGFASSAMPWARDISLIPVIPPARTG
jgi:hypothetical protein